MSDIILKVENISKQYRLGVVGTGTISHDLNRWWHKIRGKEDPFLKIGESNDRASKGNSDYVWALKDINFEVNRGEVLGIIGKNGAGKSTLLKILSKVTSPTTGSIKSRGRIASLLEVGTGFHPEMTGKENIFLNGAILGMTKKEIASKLDEIVEFSGCERYIDTPVKRYSSGMKVRLAFAVAAHLEPDILVVDEVLAVGDAEFQKKAIGKMQEISQEGGRTVLFVSHNMAAVKSLCTRGIVLENGRVVFAGDTASAVNNYLELTSEELKYYYEYNGGLNELVVLKSTQLKHNESRRTIFTGDDLELIVKIESKYKKRIRLFFGVYNQYEEKLIHAGTIYSNNTKSIDIDNEIISLKCVLKEIPFSAGIYKINLSLHVDNTPYKRIKNALIFKVESGDFYSTGSVPPENESKILLKQNWEISHEKNIV